MREKDEYGLYELCVQCGYLHDLQTVGRLHNKRAEQQNKEEAAQSVMRDGSNDGPHNTPELTEYSHNKQRTFPPDLQSILNQLLKEHQNKPHQK